MHYYRVKSGQKTWTDKGPDLLRPLPNARRALRGLIRDDQLLATRYSDGKDGFTDWVAGNRTKVMDRFATWSRKQDGVFQVGSRAHVNAVDVEVVAVVKHEPVPFIDLPHCTRDTSVAYSLAKYQFPKIILSGAFFYREVEGSPGYWSDHAWGTALDESPRVITNDVLFDWNVRMARERCFEADEIIGSIDGKVKAASAPDFEIRPSGAAVSHTWHVHLSIVDHDGARPPRNPMVR